MLSFRNRVLIESLDKFLILVYECMDFRNPTNFLILFWYQRSVELNPTQKDLVLKIAELLCKNDVSDGRAKYWVERAAKLFPGSPAIYKLKVKN